VFRLILVINKQGARKGLVEVQGPQPACILTKCGILFCHCFIPGDAVGLYEDALAENSGIIAKYHEVIYLLPVGLLG
jgi:hypothetical protein